MSTPPVPTKPDEQTAEQRYTREDPTRGEDAPAQGPATGTLPEPSPERAGDERREPAPQTSFVLPPSDRTVDADLVLDIPQVSVEQLTLELDASVLLNSVKLDAKGLEAGLYLKANLDLVRMLVQKDDTEHAHGAAANATPSRRGSDTTRVPTAPLRELLRATRGEPAGEREGGQDGRSNAPLERARHAAGEGVKAAALTAAGLAGGALVESRTKPSRKMPLPRRRGRAQAIGHEIVKRLPSR